MCSLSRKGSINTKGILSVEGMLLFKLLSANILFPQYTKTSSVIPLLVHNSCNFIPNLTLFVLINCFKRKRPLKSARDLSTLKFFPGEYFSLKFLCVRSINGQALCKQSRFSSFGLLFGSSYY